MDSSVSVVGGEENAVGFCVSKKAFKNRHTSFYCVLLYYTSQILCFFTN